MAGILEKVEQKILNKERISREEALELFATDDLISLGALANQVRVARWGNKAYFVINRQINPTNICVLSCKFCDFARKPGAKGAYEMTLKEIVGLCSDELREVHIVGGLHPDWKWEFYLEMMRAITTNFPNIKIKAWTAVEIDFFARKFRLTIKQVLLQLKEAGLSALPGGGAEVFSERVRSELFASKIGAETWFEVHRTAHELNIPTNSTLLYGHIETHEERVEHLFKLRDLEDESPGFMSFIPLAYQLGETKLVKRQASAIEDLKTIAISRLVLDNIPHIKAYWVTMGEEIASMALHFGADDIDGTIGDERVMHAADAASPATLTRDRLIELITESGCMPIERNCLYETIHVYDHTNSKSTVS